MSECTHDCSTCGADCASRDPASFLEKPHELSNIKKVIGVVSGKGGVGKSLVTSMLAVAMNRRGRRTAILDADVTGPSIPKMFGLKEKAGATGDALLPVVTKTGIEVMSVNLLLENEDDPVVWRGPVIAGTVKQFWTDVIWNDVDFLFVDMPPGTGDVPLTVFQSLPVDGIIVVTSPQELVSVIVSKAVKMAGLMDIPVLGLVENMSFVKCPDCGKKIFPFGEGGSAAVALEFGIPLLAQLPLDRDASRAADTGTIELYTAPELDPAADRVESLL
ncbi:MAG: Mrp/NBP35 family ATP-binding protein [Oscillospiraceae bacterium]|nr:Mrp/NBP35 family ATP-binding protein [Oscillospiraceae bacterium]